MQDSSLALQFYNLPKPFSLNIGRLHLNHLTFKRKPQNKSSFSQKFRVNINFECFVLIKKVEKRAIIMEKSYKML